MGSSKWQGPPPAKKACTESPMPQKTLKSKSRKVSHTLWDEWEEHEESRKEPEYKDMHYLTFALVMELEQSIFKKCSFNQPPIFHLSPLWGLDKPSLGSKSTYSKTTCWLQQSQSNINHFWKKGYGPSESHRAVPFCFQHPQGPFSMEVSKIPDTTSRVGHDSCPHGGYEKVLWISMTRCL